MSAFETYSSRLPDPEFQPEFYAGTPSKRAFAWVLDTAIIVAFCAIIIPFTAFTALFFLPFLYLVVGFVYRWVTISSRSSTLGMRLMAIEFRGHDGERLSSTTAFLHTLGYTVSMSMVLPQVISVGLMMVSPRGQGLSDFVLGTAAINRPARY